MKRIVNDPASGVVVRMRAGEAIEVRMRRGMGVCDWRVTQLPPHLEEVPLPAELANAEAARGPAWSLRFLAFRATARGAGPLRLEYGGGADAEAREVRHLVVVAC